MLCASLRLALEIGSKVTIETSELKKSLNLDGQ